MLRAEKRIKNLSIQIPSYLIPVQQTGKLSVLTMTHLNTSSHINHTKVYRWWLLYHSHQPRFIKIKDKM